MAVPKPPARRGAEFEDKLGRGDEEFFSPGYPREMMAMGVGEEGDTTHGEELGFYVGEVWVVMDVPVVHVGAPFQMMAPRAWGGRYGGRATRSVRASEWLRTMERGEGSSVASTLGPQGLRGREAVRGASPDAADLRGIIQNVGNRLDIGDEMLVSVQA